MYTIIFNKEEEENCSYLLIYIYIVMNIIFKSFVIARK